MCMEYFIQNHTRSQLYIKSISTVAQKKKKVRSNFCLEATQADTVSESQPPPHVNHKVHTSHRRYRSPNRSNTLHHDPKPSPLLTNSPSSCYHSRKLCWACTGSTRHSRAEIAQSSSEKSSYSHEPWDRGI